MINTALVRLFDILNTVEKKRIKKKLENKERSGVDMLLLFNYLDKYIKKPAKLDKERVYKAVFGKLKKFKDQKLTTLRFKLYRFIEDQIVVEQIMGVNENKEHLIQKELILLDYFRDKVVPNNQSSVEGIARLVENKMTDVENLINITKVKDIFYHLNLYRLSHYLYYNLSTEIRGEGKLYIEQLMKNLDVFYFLSKLKYSFEMMQRQKILNEDQLPIFLFNEIYKYSECLDAKENPLVSIYRLLADLSHELDKNKIIEVKTILLENAGVIGAIEMKYSLNLLLNFMFRINREKHIDMTMERYDVNQFILENKLFVDNGEIRPQFLVNCAANFLHAGKSNEIEQMLTHYKDYIAKRYREKIVNLCSAFQLFGAGEFTKCSNLLYKKSYLPFNLQAKTLLLKSLYEIEINLKKTDGISFFDALDNYKRYIRRRKEDKGKDNLNKNLYIGALNFANCLLKITETSYEDTDFINNFDYIVEKKWLLRKIKMSNSI